ncbi:MAG: hypothetical protein H6835_14805 [Planctomycetes bacterium]|nr:hypothetical protein [Planctomycetota bacterium]
MPTRPRILITALWLALAACQGPGATLARQLEQADRDRVIADTVRLLLDGDRVIGGATPAVAAEVPPAVRTTFDAVAPEGEQLFLGREWGPRGAGFRLEKRYLEPAHQRSVLVAADGHVLERAHTLPVPRVPKHVLATALEVGPFVDEARIVSGPLQEEYWALLVRDRAGALRVVLIDLDGAELARRRRVTARVDS